jgi:capsular polysaccharide transport system ATP-binding protein
MIEICDVVKEYQTHSGRRRVLDGINARVEPGEKLAILGANGAGKTTLMKLLGGVEEPTSGSIERTMSLSWPLGFMGGFHPHMTGIDNVRFIARIYNQPMDRILAYAQDFSELGKELYMPLETYSTGMRARLAFGLSLAIDFDCYLIDEVIAVGDQRFQRKCQEELFHKRKDRAMILASHSLDIVRLYCTHALVLKQGRGKVFHDIEFALRLYSDL